MKWFGEQVETLEETTLQIQYPLNDIIFLAFLQHGRDDKSANQEYMHGNCCSHSFVKKRQAF